MDKVRLAACADCEPTAKQGAAVAMHLASHLSDLTRLDPSGLVGSVLIAGVGRV